ncbi:hypothetical protein [Micromonospora carbonacea]|uniref:HK97 gp10 family phage protein n=1 Tax=Micromonospora carbonacea TaxID=47853 RepID=A0A1C5A2W0_9ACTN|nr:hypothetical protein [Micromonospora carbonacea]SCF39476.1 hypothetical protein GA0070563_11126 [Micromonospora carbonacea]
MGEKIETRELHLLAVDLDEAAAAAPGEVRKVVQKGALNIKTDWRRRWTGHPHAPRLPYAVTYDTRETPTGSSAEIGPDKEKTQGALGNLFEFGSVNNAPIPGGIPAAEAEKPRFEKALEDLAVRLLEDRP